MPIRSCSFISKIAFAICFSSAAITILPSYLNKGSSLISSFVIFFPEEAVAYLNAALAEEDPEVFLLALRDVARTREGGLAALAETAQLNREHLYRMLSENGNPELRSLEALLDALGFRLSVELKATG